MSSMNSDTNKQGNAIQIRPGLAFIIMIFGALIAFEIFNYSTTDHALSDLLGDLTFAGIPWSTILSIAFCGIDFAGIARLFTPEQGADEPKEVWYLFGAWLLAATMNAILTWWGVSVAVMNNSLASSSVVDPQTLTSVVPVFVAIMVWVIRILIIATLSLAMDRLLHPGAQKQIPLQRLVSAQQQPLQQPARPNSLPNSLNNTGGFAPRPAVRSTAAASASAGGRSPNPRGPSGAHGASFSGSTQEEDGFFDGPPAAVTHTEPTYHSINGRKPNDNNANERFRRT